MKTNWPPRPGTTQTPEPESATATAPGWPEWSYRMQIERISELMRNAGSAINAISRIVIEDAARSCTSEGGYLDPIDHEGLMLAVQLIGRQLQNEADEQEFDFLARVPGSGEAEGGS